MKTGQKKHQGYSSDAEYIEAELEWIRARCQRIGAEHLVAQMQEKKERMGFLRPADEATLDATREGLPMLREEEARYRTTIEARLKASGPRNHLGLDQLCHEHDLDLMERTVLLLAVLPTLGEPYSDLLGDLYQRGYFGGALSIEGAWAFLGLSVPERLAAHRTFGPRGRLVESGLMTLQVGPGGPTDLPGAILELSSEAFTRITGVADE